MLERGNFLSVQTLIGLQWDFFILPAPNKSELTSGVAPNGTGLSKTPSPTLDHSPTGSRFTCLLINAFNGGGREVEIQNHVYFMLRKLNIFYGCRK